jgi:hypothetical protein
MNPPCEDPDLHDYIDARRSPSGCSAAGAEDLLPAQNGLYHGQDSAADTIRSSVKIATGSARRRRPYDACVGP